MMDKYHKWKELLSDDDKRKEWIEYYQAHDPTFAEVLDFLKDEVDDSKKLELAIIVLLDQKVNTLSDRAQMAHSMSRPLPRKLKLGQSAYPEDYHDNDN